MIAKIHSFESCGTVDGPGIRYVIFFKGCPLRCRYCHNPDTWTQEGAQEYDVNSIVTRALKYKGYWGDKGGITVTGGEPLVQIDFVTELFKEFKKHNVNTTCDTSGFMFNPNDEKSILYPIESEKEWKIVETILSELQNEVGKGTEN